VFDVKKEAADVAFFLLSPMALNVVVYLDVLWTWLQDLFVNPAAGRLRSL